MSKYSQISTQTKAAENINIEDSDEDKRFIAFGEGFMSGFDGLRKGFNPYSQAFDYPLYSWYEKGYTVGAMHATGKRTDE